MGMGCDGNAEYGIGWNGDGMGGGMGVGIWDRIWDGIDR